VSRVENGEGLPEKIRVLNYLGRMQLLRSDPDDIRYLFSVGETLNADSASRSSRPTCRSLLHLYFKQSNRAWLGHNCITPRNISPPHILRFPEAQPTPCLSPILSVPKSNSKDPADYFNIMTVGIPLCPIFVLTARLFEVTSCLLAEPDFSSIDACRFLFFRRDVLNCRYKILGSLSFLKKQRTLIDA
jgi:hypothetical protein